MNKRVADDADSGDIRQELVRLTQLLIVEGAKIVGAFAELHGLHHTDVEAMGYVRIAEDRGTPMTAGALAAELGLTSGAITFVIDRLERAGHLTRQRDSNDRRKVLLRYSAEGRALADDFFAAHGRHGNAVMDQFTPEELQIVQRYLAATGTAMATHRHSLTPPAQT